MTVEQQRKRNWGRTVTWAVVLVLAGIALGSYFTAQAQPPQRITAAPAGTDSMPWKGLLQAPACAVPVIALTLITLGFTAVQGYYSVQRLEAQRRIQAAEAAEREEEVRLQALRTQRRQAELNDLTVNLATGEEVARLMQGPQGEWLLVRPGLATKPVSRLDPDEVREDTDQVRVAAMVANAARYRGGRNPTRGNSSLSLEMAALTMLNGGGNVDRRLPSSIHVLNEDEVQILKDNRNE